MWIAFALIAVLRAKAWSAISNRRCRSQAAAQETTMKTVTAWVGDRLREGSTYMGGALTAFSHVHIQLADPHQQSMLQACQTLAAFVGPLMVGMTTRHG